MLNHFDQGWGLSAPFVGLCSHKMVRADFVELGPKNTNQDEAEHERVKTQDGPFKGSNCSCDESMCGSGLP